MLKCCELFSVCRFLHKEHMKYFIVLLLSNKYFSIFIIKVIHVCDSVKAKGFMVNIKILPPYLTSKYTLNIFSKSNCYRSLHPHVNMYSECVFILPSSSFVQLTIYFRYIFSAKIYVHIINNGSFVFRFTAIQ